MELRRGFELILPGLAVNSSSAESAIQPESIWKPLGSYRFDRTFWKLPHQKFEKLSFFSVNMQILKLYCWPKFCIFSNFCKYYKILGLEFHQSRSCSLLDKVMLFFRVMSFLTACRLYIYSDQWHVCMLFIKVQILSVGQVWHFRHQPNLSRNIWYDWTWSSWRKNFTILL